MFALFRDLIEDFLDALEPKFVQNSGRTFAVSSIKNLYIVLHFFYSRILISLKDVSRKKDS